MRLLRSAAACPGRVNASEFGSVTRVKPPVARFMWPIGVWPRVNGWPAFCGLAAAVGCICCVRVVADGNGRFPGIGTAHPLEHLTNRTSWWNWPLQCGTAVGHIVGGISLPGDAASAIGRAERLSGANSALLRVQRAACGIVDRRTNNRRRQVTQHPPAEDHSCQCDQNSAGK